MEGKSPQIGSQEPPNSRASLVPRGSPCRGSAPRLTSQLRRLPSLPSLSPPSRGISPTTLPSPSAHQSGARARAASPLVSSRPVKSSRSPSSHLPSLTSPSAHDSSPSSSRPLCSPIPSARPRSVPSPCLGRLPPRTHRLPSPSLSPSLARQTKESSSVRSTAIRLARR
ncbi:unnamed protein product [Arctogadus glacialis]